MPNHALELLQGDFARMAIHVAHIDAARQLLTGYGPGGLYERMPGDATTPQGRVHIAKKQIGRRQIANDGPGIRPDRVKIKRCQGRLADRNVLLEKLGQI